MNTVNYNRASLQLPSWPGVVDIMFGFLGHRNVAALCLANKEWAKKNSTKQHEGMHAPTSLVVLVRVKEFIASHPFTYQEYNALKKLEQDKIARIFPCSLIHSFVIEDGSSADILSEISKDIKNMPELKFLSMGAVKVNPDSSKGINPHIVHYLRKCFLRDLKLTKLESLRFYGMKSEDLFQLNRMTTLTNLDLPHGIFTNESLSSLCSLTQLKTLHFFVSFDESKYQPPHRKTSDAGIKHLSSLINLTDLDLSGIEITDAGLVHLSKLKLEVLNLSGCRKLTDACLDELRSFGTLRHLSLDECEGISSEPRAALLDEVNARH